MSCSFEWGDELYHYGRKGMKWYQHIFGAAKSAGNRIKSAHQKSVEKKQRRKDEKLNKKAAHGNRRAIREKLSKMTPEEISAEIRKMELEKRYLDTVKNSQSEIMKKGKALVSDILSNSIKTVGIQATTWALGTAVNKALNADIVKVAKRNTETKAEPKQKQEAKTTEPKQEDKKVEQKKQPENKPKQEPKQVEQKKQKSMADRYIQNSKNKVSSNSQKNKEPFEQIDSEQKKDSFADWYIKNSKHKAKAR